MFSKLRGEEGSSASAIRKGSRKIARRADYMMVAQLGKMLNLKLFILRPVDLIPVKISGFVIIKN